MISSGPIAATQDLISVKQKVAAFIVTAKVKASDGLSISEFAELTVALLRVVMAAVDSLPDDYRSRAYGLDFGYTTDPTALVELRLTSQGLWVDELIYANGLLNRHISDRLHSLGFSPEDRITADSAEPKSIDELRSHGWRVRAAVKGADSVRNGIALLQQQTIFVTSSSLNTIKELQNYKWKEMKESSASQRRYDSEPVDAFNHSIDAMRYGAQAILTRKEKIILT